MKLKAYRQLMHLTQAEVAAVLGIPTKTYQNYERGDREPDSDVLCALADYYGVSLDSLVGRTDMEPVAHDRASSTVDPSLLSQLEEAFSMLSQDGQAEALKRMRELTRLSEYTNQEL